MLEFLHALGVVEVLEASRLAADDAEQARPDLVLAGLGGMAERALLECRLASLDVGREDRNGDQECEAVGES
jgi:hypothetical protein